VLERIIDGGAENAQALMVDEGRCVELEVAGKMRRHVFLFRPAPPRPAPTAPITLGEV